MEMCKECEKNYHQAETKEYLQAKIAAWRACLETKGLKIKAGKTIVMVS